MTSLSFASRSAGASAGSCAGVRAASAVSASAEPPLLLSRSKSPKSFPLPMTEERRLALERLFSRIGEVTSLPATAQRVLQLTEDENADADQLREAIQSDPVLVARLLRRLNSSYYGLSQRISDMKAAIN